MTTLTIDNFSVSKGVSYTPMPGLVSVSNQRDYIGGLHVSSLFVPKEMFQIQIDGLTQSQVSQLEKIYNSITSLLHTISYNTPTMQRLWDSSTVLNGILNSDIGRVRNQCFISGFTKNNYAGVPDTYQVSLTLEES